MLKAAQVRGALRPTAVLDRFGVRYTQSFDELRFGVCPTCRARSRNDSVAVNAISGAFYCHVHGCTGDVFTLVAGLAGLDVRTEFPAVIKLAATIAGITSDGISPDLQRRLDEDRRRADAARVAVEAKRQAALAAMATRWNVLATRSVVGERYLAARGFDPAALRDVGDVVRYGVRGDPAVALRDLATGVICGVQYRYIDGFPKISCARGSREAGSALFGRVADIGVSVDAVYLTEGIADTLAAVLAWPRRAVFGAAGAGQLATIAAAIAPRIAAARGWLFIAPHVDGGTGERAAADAIIAAEGAGLALGKSIHLVDVRPAKDLAESFAQWRRSARSA